MSCLLVCLSLYSCEHSSKIMIHLDSHDLFKQLVKILDTSFIAELHLLFNITLSTFNFRQLSKYRIMGTGLYLYSTVNPTSQDGIKIKASLGLITHGWFVVEVFQQCWINCNQTWHVSVLHLCGCLSGSGFSPLASLHPLFYVSLVQFFHP